MQTYNHAELVEKIESLYEYERTKQIEPWADLWDATARVTFPLDATPGQRDVIGKDAIVAWTAKKFVERERSEIETRIEALLLDRRVLVNMNVMLHFVNGTEIGGPIVIIFTFNDEGRITLMEEYVNEAIFPIHYKELAKPTESAE